MVNKKAYFKTQFANIRTGHKNSTVDGLSDYGLVISDDPKFRNMHGLHPTEIYLYGYEFVNDGHVQAASSRTFSKSMHCFHLKI